MKYLYNGIKLPKLPDYDTSVYSDAYIVRLGVQELYSLILLPAGWSYVYNQTDADSTNYIGTSGVTGKYYNASTESAEWHSPTEVENPVIYSDKLTPVWSNFDIIAEGGSVYLAASEPAPAWDKRSFWMGVALGLAGKGLPPMRTPTAYLYNGVKLPPLPEWDREKYPFAVITYSRGGSMLHCCAENAVWVELFNNYSDNHLVFNDAHLQCQYNTVSTVFEWEELEEVSTRSTPTTNFVWSNFDIYDTDGVLAFSASEPVPVYE